MPIPTLHSKRLYLRSLQPGDEGFVASLDADAEVMQYIHRGPLTQHAAQKWAEIRVQGAMFHRNFGRWMITVRNANSTRIGWVELAKYHGPPVDDTLNDYFALGYQMDPAYRGHGYMTEAAKAVLDYAFECGLQKVLAYARPENVRSLKLIERLGFRRVSECMDDARNECVLYQIKQEEWPGG